MSILTTNCSLALQIDILIFGLVEDDTLAVLSSIIGDWRLVSVLIACVFILAILSLIFLKPKLTQTQEATDIAHWKNGLIIFFIIATLFVGARGSLDTFPLSRKVSSISNNNFINSLVMNAPFHHLLQARRKFNSACPTCFLFNKTTIESHF